MEIALAHGMGYGYGFNPFLAFFGFLFNLLFFILFFMFMVWLVRAMKRGRWGRHGWRRMRPAGGPWGRWGSDEAAEAARERYARGEVSKEQYEAIKTGLQDEAAREARESREDWNFKGWWNRDGALETARMRFAKGEISLEEYQAIRRGLEG